MTDHVDVPVVATGDWIDAAWINQYIGDNVRAWRQGFTAAGDIPYAVDGNTIAALTAVANGVLIGGSTPSYVAPSTGKTFLMFDGSAFVFEPIVRRRQGGSATVWTSPGSTTYTPTGWKALSGYKNVTVAGTDGFVAISYPVAFTQRPHIILSVDLPSSTPYVWSLGHSDDTVNGFNAHIKFAGSLSITCAIGWFAFSNG